MERSEFSEMARDPALVPGVYNYCDHWCAYCPMTGCCLVFRMRTKWDAEHDAAERETLENAVAFTREVARAAGKETPELDAAEAGRAVRKVTGEEHPAEQLARDYAFVAGMLLSEKGWNPAPDDLVASAPPTPFDVVGWYHLLIASKVARAFDSASPALHAPEDRWSDALGSTKVALIGIERSRTALETLRKKGGFRIFPDPVQLLDELESQLTACFPGARTFVRAGFDRATA